ncbi:MAG: helix-turn-helix transcriptional regulator [Thermodesulfovibrionales bacterium]|nr:helix-turn-helix transcriptional regulator [Thermodesulfovibrionales bacterium]
MAKVTLGQKIGQRIKEARKKRKLTQEKFAELCGLSTDYIGKIERGKQLPTLKTLYQITKILNASLAYILDFDTKTMPLHEIQQLLKNQSPETIQQIIQVIKVLIGNKT